ncbi:Transcriptional regulatory protein, MarR family protein [Nitrobacter sp. Nb-311A]|uniref:MarR family winged helix-turn-helix transcriptional regulator n=1 Tax=unclassified Nitrobacter TaxID=2620411 RepID=UPI00006863C3|nr:MULTISPECIES: MarR family transcriptional regulator [unclassified Nitrobacter]EAQ37364.1 Transcriptional regulatory protein, MarR family protein [Nitrobacter sp. Nb-311A]MCB1392501.1 MarR family transcriptional regulator [Nitrobacter sp.]MCV0384821.1 MarR family transcriptional regulator [Nitrobacter sp.]
MSLDAAYLISRLERLARSGVNVQGLNPAQWEALRYLSRANRFSRTPAALAGYAGSTRGTISQTLIALEQKGLASRQSSQRDGRSVELALTRRGEAVLRDDPLRRLADDIAVATGGDAGELLATLQDILSATIARNGGRAFGVCCTCRHFRRNAKPGSASPHHCNLLDEALSESDGGAICQEHAAA